jgi:hypothetical protein
MPETKISSADTTGMSNIDWRDTASYSNSMAYTPDNAAAEELVYICDWSKWKGYYDVVPELQAVIDKKALWAVGKGYKALNSRTATVLKRIKGCGVDTANDVFANLMRTYTTGGDAFAEIIRDARGYISNLKPLNPGSMKIIANSSGIIIRYEQWNWEKKKMVKSFLPHEIFHLAWQRLADAIHGTGTISKLTDIIDARKEGFADMRTVFHRYVKPLVIVFVDEDDPVKIAAFKAKLDSAVQNSENMVVQKTQLTRLRGFQFLSIQLLTLCHG